MSNKDVFEERLGELWADTITKYVPIEILSKFDINIQLECQNHAYAITFHKSLYEDEFSKLKYGNERLTEAIVLFYDRFFLQPPEMQEFVILHEYAHLWLNHLTTRGNTQQENDAEADKLAEKWISETK